MDLSNPTNGTIFFLFIYFIIYLAIPIGIVFFIVRTIINQKKLKLDIQLIKNRLNELESKILKD